ncbi:MAG: 16S rRNA (guanine(966)-N(2))-methyltransferase RsmD [Casimicrobiaceae bacterium]|nr:16S rRNA (guanine(966)-N(2))-methyltransferase RsmD [Casimicrobiaceae bacterium]MDW8312421.1 16S rRNA (guanine(966)-N(2))-methyltransferase RsmD [Burkholderiales bacterium]
MPPPSKNQLRIIAGSHRSRLIRFPEAARLPGFRPTPDRVRETLFNWLGQELTGLVCLDLFAGSGALAFEAASRGAARVVAVERERAAVLALKRNREQLGLSAVAVYHADAFAWLATSGECFDVVFLDPPFASDPWQALARSLPARLTPGARVYCESAKPLSAFGGLRLNRQGRAGLVHYHLFVHDLEAHSPPQDA